MVTLKLQKFDFFCFFMLLMATHTQYTYAAQVNFADQKAPTPSVVNVKVPQQLGQECGIHAIINAIIMMNALAPENIWRPSFCDKRESLLNFINSMILDYRKELIERNNKNIENHIQKKDDFIAKEIVTINHRLEIEKKAATDTQMKNAIGWIIRLVPEISFTILKPILNLSEEEIKQSWTIWVTKNKIHEKLSEILHTIFYEPNNKNDIDVVTNSKIRIVINHFLVKGLEPKNQALLKEKLPQLSSLIEQNERFKLLLPGIFNLKQLILKKFESPTSLEAEENWNTTRISLIRHNDELKALTPGYSYGIRYCANLSSGEIKKIIHDGKLKKFCSGLGLYHNPSLFCVYEKDIDLDECIKKGLVKTYQKTDDVGFIMFQDGHWVALKITNPSSKGYIWFADSRNNIPFSFYKKRIELIIKKFPKRSASFSILPPLEEETEEQNSTNGPD